MAHRYASREMLLSSSGRQGGQAGTGHAVVAREGQNRQMNKGE